MPEILNKLKLTPYAQLITFLSTMALFAVYNTPTAIANLTIILLASLAFYFTAQKFLPNKKKLLPSVFATSLIIFLIWHPTNSFAGYLLTLITITFALSLKYFGQHKAMSIFNPAALAVFVMTIINNYFNLSEFSFVSWWGASFMGQTALAIILLWIIFGLNKWHKLPTALSFIFGYFALAYFVAPELAQANLLNGTIYFMGAVMLVDPKSSPFKSSHQYIFGFTSAIILLLLYEFKFQNAEILTILIINLLFILSQVILKATNRGVKATN